MFLHFGLQTAPGHTGPGTIVILPEQVYASRWRQAREDGLPQPPLSAGFTYELCAGIIDKSKSLEDIAREEVLLLLREHF